MASAALRFTIDLVEVDRTDLPACGGKGANLGVLTRVDGVHVPAGFCVTTDAYRLMIRISAISDALGRLVEAPVGHRATIAEASESVRRSIENTAIPGAIATAISDALRQTSERDEVTAYAVRSSATAEDLPTASFAGQHESFLNIVGTDAVLDRVRACWASLFTERAVLYRIQHGIDHLDVAMAVVVQRSLDADASGVMFTADPATSNRRIVCIEATPGLGESLVSGHALPDAYRIRDDQIIDATITAKTTALMASPGGGLHETTVGPEQRTRPTLTETDAVELARLGRHIEAHLGGAQDIEWCLVGGAFYVVQSRPITTLFPIPPTDDDERHVYVSVGHNQMMTDAMKPLGLSFWQMTTPRPMAEAGGRLFVDVTRMLSSPATRAGLLDLFGRGDPLVRDAMETVIERDGFLPPPPDEPPPGPLQPPPADPLPNDPQIVADLVAANRESVAALERDIADCSGVDLFDFIVDDLAVLRQHLSGPVVHQAAMAGMEATWWLHDHLDEWLGDRTGVDAITQSAPGNVTSEMGLALLDVADVIRPHAAVVDVLGEAGAHADFFSALDGVTGGTESVAAVRQFLEAYGARCVGEIDITRPRWSEQPSALAPILVSHVHHFAPGEAARRVEQGLRNAEAAERDILGRLRELPDGAAKAGDAKQMIDRVRTFIGFREYPKFGMIRRYFAYKQALLREARRLVRAGILLDPVDVFFLRLDEFRDVVATNSADRALIEERRAAHRWHETLAPPRVLTSEGDSLVGSYRRDDVPPGALVGLPVSSGAVEGRARVITSMAEADLEPGDILVTTHTDPSWTPVFVTISGLVTEVGGLMTHGAVIAREYGLPAIVGVDRATRLIGDGERIRIDGNSGLVEVISER